MEETAFGWLVVFGAFATFFGILIGIRRLAKAYRRQEPQLDDLMPPIEGIPGMGRDRLPDAVPPLRTDSGH